MGTLSKKHLLRFRDSQMPSAQSDGPLLFHIGLGYNKTKLVMRPCFLWSRSLHWKDGIFVLRQLSSAETRIFHDSHVNIMDANTMAPGHQQPLYWQWTTGRPFTYIAKDFNGLYHSVLQNYAFTNFQPMKVKSSALSAAYMHLWIGPSLFQIMACRLLSAKPLSKPMMSSHQWHPKKQFSMKKKLLETKQFHWWNWP